MGSTKVKEILGKQLELLAEVSESKPENLAELSAAMCEICLLYTSPSPRDA